MDYLILDGISDVDLQTQVKSWIKKGWEPLGGVSVAVYFDPNPKPPLDSWDTEFWKYVQAMIKPAPKKKDDIHF